MLGPCRAARLVQVAQFLLTPLAAAAPSAEQIEGEPAADSRVPEHPGTQNEEAPESPVAASESREPRREGPGGTEEVEGAEPDGRSDVDLAEALASTAEDSLAGEDSEASLVDFGAGDYGPFAGDVVDMRFEPHSDASGSVAEKGRRRIVLPAGRVEVSGEMAFLMSRPFLTEEQTRFSDVGLLRLRARRAFTERLELYVHTQVLAKQPSATSEPTWQGAGLGARAEVLDGFAVALGGRAGPLLDGAGLWWQAAPEALFKAEASRYLRFLVGAGGVLTVLDFSPDAGAPFWLQEATAHGEVQIGNENSAMWVGIDYAVPVAFSPRAADVDPVYGHLDPQVRLGVDVGGSVSLDASDWNAYAVFSVIDRGDLERPATTLPILDGGFDQTQIVVGVQHRFGTSAAPSGGI